MMSEPLGRKELLLAIAEHHCAKLWGLPMRNIEYDRRPSTQRPTVPVPVAAYAVAVVVVSSIGVVVVVVVLAAAKTVLCKTIFLDERSAAQGVHLLSLGTQPVLAQSGAELLLEAPWGV